MNISDLYFEDNHYLAFVLDDESRDKLLKVCPPTFKKVVCHHVTIVYKPDEKTFEKFQKDFKDSVPTVKATGILIGEHIEAVIVEMDGKSKRTYSKVGGHYHVTLSLEDPAKPVDSNKLFDDNDAKKIPFHSPITLSGEFKMIKI